MEQRIIINPENKYFFNIFNQVCKQIHYPKKEVTIITLNKEKSEKINKEIKDKYKFVFDYPENNNKIVGIEVYKII